MLERKLDAHDTILDDVTLKQLIWFGHVEGMIRTGLAEVMINWKHEGWKRRVRFRRTWKDGT